MNRIFISCTILLLMVGGQRAQGFVNLNFESANLAGYFPNDLAVPVSAAMPGWSVFSVNPTGGTNTGTQMWYDVLSTGGAGVSINDKNMGAGFMPLQGQYSAILFGGGGYSEGIGQTAIVPAGSESLQVQIATLGGPLTPFVVTLGGQTLDMIPLETLPSYTLYGADISKFALQDEALTIIEPPPAGTPPSVLVLDNIIFSTSPVPEPATFALIFAGAVLFGVCRRRKSLP